VLFAHPGQVSFCIRFFDAVKKFAERLNQLVLGLQGFSHFLSFSEETRRLEKKTWSHEFPGPDSLECLVREEIMILGGCPVCPALCALKQDFLEVNFDDELL